MRPFGLEVFFSKHEFTAKHHMTASDIESMSQAELLALASDDDRASFQDLWLGYTETWGAPDLRAEIANTYETLDPANVLCMAGAGEGIYAAMRVLLNAHDHLVVPVPNYQSAETLPLQICQVTGVAMTYGANQGWQLDLDAIKQAVRPNTKAISLNFPHNPTGFVMAKDEMDELIDFARSRGLYLFVDEVYRGVELDPDEALPQIADVYEKGISLNVMSKAYGLPGLRVGWLASQDKNVLAQVERFKHYLSICNAAPAERLSLIALKARDKILEKNRKLLQRNLKRLEDLLFNHPTLFEWHRPKGGAVAYPKYLGEEGVEVFCKSLLKKHGILFLPASIYKSDLVSEEERVDKNHFRLGFGRDKGFLDGLDALAEALANDKRP